MRVTQALEQMRAWIKASQISDEEVVSIHFGPHQADCYLKREAFLRAFAGMRGERFADGSLRCRMIDITFHSLPDEAHHYLASPEPVVF